MVTLNPDVCVHMQLHASCRAVLTQDSCVCYKAYYYVHEMPALHTSAATSLPGCLTADHVQACQQLLMPYLYGRQRQRWPCGCVGCA